MQLEGDSDITASQKRLVLNEVLMIPHYAELLVIKSAFRATLFENLGNFISKRIERGAPLIDAEEAYQHRSKPIDFLKTQRGIIPGAYVTPLWEECN